MTYGDGVADIDIKALLDFHMKKGKVATLTATDVNQRFGVLDLTGENSVKAFKEKVSDGNKINVGYMVLEPAVFDYLDDDTTVFEKKPLETLADQGQLVAYIHNGFWQCMDTKRERDKLEKLWASGQAPWKVWCDDE